MSYPALPNDPKGQTKDLTATIADTLAKDPTVAKAVAAAAAPHVKAAAGEAAKSAAKHGAEFAKEEAKHFVAWEKGAVFEAAHHVEDTIEGFVTTEVGSNQGKLMFAIWGTVMYAVLNLLYIGTIPWTDWTAWVALCSIPHLINAYFRPAARKQILVGAVFSVVLYVYVTIGSFFHILGLNVRDMIVNTTLGVLLGGTHILIAITAYKEEYGNDERTPLLNGKGEENPGNASPGAKSEKFVDLA